MMYVVLVGVDDMVIVDGSIVVKHMEEGGKKKLCARMRIRE